MYFTLDAGTIIGIVAALYIAGLLYEAWRRYNRRNSTGPRKSIRQQFRGRRMVRERETYERWDNDEPVYHTTVTRYLNGDYYHDANTREHGQASNSPMDRVRGMLK